LHLGKYAILREVINSDVVALIPVGRGGFTVWAPGHVPGLDSAVYRNSGELPWWLWLLHQPEFTT
jgi:hypothetical protein